MDHLKTINVLHIIESLGAGGKERQLVELAGFLKDSPEVSCEIVLMSEGALHYDHVRSLGVPIFTVTRRWKNDITVFGRMFRLIRERNPDVIHSWGSMCSICALPAAKILGIPFINGFLRDAPESLSIRDTEYRRAMITFPFSDRILSNSLAGLEAYNVPEKKRILIRNGFNFTRIEEIKPVEQVKKETGIVTRYVVGMVAAFSARKDYATFFSAAHLIVNQRNDVTFITAGDGEDLDMWKSRVSHERIMFLGRRPHVMSIVNTFDIGVLSAFREGISNSIMEYMALKKPVVASDCKGNRELIDENRTGFLVEPENPEQMAAKISFLLSDEGLSQTFGKNGYDKLKNEFSLETMGRECVKLYADLARNHRRKTVPQDMES